MRWFRGRPSVVDSVSAVALMLLIGYALVDPPGPASRWPSWSAWVVGAVLAGPVAVRRRWPEPALAVAAVGALLASVLGAAAAGVLVVSFLPTVLVLYVVAGTASRRRSATALVGCLAAACAAVGFFYRDVLPTLPPAPTAASCRHCGRSSSA